jgi:archaemetzincin
LTPQAGHTILITPSNDFAADLIETVDKEIHRVFGFATAVSPLDTDLAFAFDSNREQYHSTSILNQLAAGAPEWALKVLAMVEVDLFIPILTHVYGEAQLGGRACIVSTYRLNDDTWRPVSREKLLQRVAKESVHELGHTFNLRHCRDHKCIMHYCRSEADVDLKSGELCRYCGVLLQDEMNKLVSIQKG